MCPPVFPLIQVGHDAVDNVWLRGEEVDGIDVMVRGAAVGDLLNVWSESGRQSMVWMGERVGRERTNL